MPNTPHKLTVHGAGNDTEGHFTFLVASGGGWELTDSVEDPDRIEQHGRRFSGRVNNTGHDTARFGGILIAAAFAGDVGDVAINGKHYDPADLPEAWQRDASVRHLVEPAESHELAIFSNNESNYSFRTSGAKLTPHSPEGPDKLTHNETGARGKVYGGRDSFTIHGEAVFPEFDPGDSAQVELDGEAVSGKELRNRESGDPTPVSTTGPAPEYTGPNARMGPHAPIRDANTSDWDHPEISGHINVQRQVNKHGGGTMFEIDGKVHISKQVDIDDDNVGFRGGTIVVHGSVRRALSFSTGDNPLSGIVLDDVTIDVRDAWIQKAVVNGFVRGEGMFVDLSLEGEVSGPGNGLAVLPGPDTVVEVENWSAPSGAERNAGAAESSAHDSVGIILDGGSDGTLRVHNAENGGWPNNGIYASGPTKHGNDGRAVITDSELYDSDRDQFRIGSNSIAKNLLCYADTLKAGFDNTRGAWVRYGRNALVEGCTIKTHYSDPGEAVRIDSTTGEATIRDNDVECRSSDHRSRGVLAKSPSSNAGDDVDVTIEDNQFSGDGCPRDVILIQEGRDSSTVEGNDIDVPNAGENVDFRR